MSRRAASGRRCLPPPGVASPALSDALGSIDTVTIDPLDRRARLVTGVLDAALTVVVDKGPQEKVLSPASPPRSPAA